MFLPVLDNNGTFNSTGIAQFWDFYKVNWSRTWEYCPVAKYITSYTPERPFFVLLATQGKKKRKETAHKTHDICTYKKVASHPRKKMKRNGTQYT